VGVGPGNCKQPLSSPSSSPGNQPVHQSC